MKLLAISDEYIPAEFMREGLASLVKLGVDIEVRHWEHPTLIALQEANLAIEKGGPEAVVLPPELTENIGDFDCIVTQFAPIGQCLIKVAEHLKVIGVLRGGTENIDVELATARRIAVLNTPGRNARAVAECTMGLILSEVRNLARAHASIKSSHWRRQFPNSEAIPELYQKTIGLVGFGAVGQLVAGYLHAFGSRVIAYDPYFKGEASFAEMVDLQTLLATSDVVSIHARLTDATHHLIGESGTGAHEAHRRARQHGPQRPGRRGSAGAGIGFSADHGSGARCVRRRAAAERSPAADARQRDPYAAPGRQHDRHVSQQPTNDGWASGSHAPRRAAAANCQRCGALIDSPERTLPRELNMSIGKEHARNLVCKHSGQLEGSDK